MYQALYRKYRPSDFDDVISQPHITTTLKNQIINGKTAHAYLFTGSRGTGKTTCARIFAKALNCEHPVNGNPCNRCDSCRGADSFAVSDIIEIDAASNNSVNDARELREGAVYAPERCRYKVYIIDEVHMLSKDAFNALLKIIEEPPAHVKFIMATTELHKVLPTILSRCQRFDFVRIKTGDISQRLLEIAKKEGISLDGEAAELIARTADGGMRDALSILDRCIAFSENITAEVVSDAAGIAGRDYLFSLVRAVSDKDSAKALEIISELYSRSKDMQRLCEELTAQMRNIMIAISAPSCTDIIVCLPSELEIIRDIAKKIDLETVLGYIDALGKCAERMTRSLSKRTDMEMCIIKMCMETSLQTETPAADSEEIRRLNSRIAALEEQLRRETGTSDGDRRGRNSLTAERKTIPAPAEQNSDTAAASAGKYIYESKWPEIIERLKIDCPSLAPMLGGSDGYSYQNKFLVNSKSTFLKTLLGTEENRGRVLSAICGITGKSFNAVLAGYKAELDRSLNSTEAPKSGPSAEEKLSELIKRAESGGVPIENI